MAYDYITKYTAKNYTPGPQCRGVFGYEREILFITIHHWGAMRPYDPSGAQFHAMCRYLASANDRNVSSSYVAQRGMVACLINDADASWANGSSKGNAQSITIECHPQASPEDKATVAELIADIRDAYPHKEIVLVGHNYWIATACPGRYDVFELDRMTIDIQRGRVKPAAAKAPKPIQEDDMPSAKEVAEENWDVEIGLGKDKYQTGSYLLWTHNNTGRILDRISAQNAQIEGLAGAVVALSKGEKLDVNKLLAGVEAAAKRGVESGFESVTRTETVTAKVK